MRNVPLSEVDHLDRDVLPIATDYPNGYVLPAHQHRRAQLLHAAGGVMTVQLADATWIVPAAQAVLIPPLTDHQVRFEGASTLSLYIEPGAVPWWPHTATVIEVGPLLRQLLVAAADLPEEHDTEGRDGRLLRLTLDEIARATPLPMSLPLPLIEPMRSLCLEYLADPHLSITNTTWATRLGTSERTLDRDFRAQTRTSPAAWRTRARVLAAIPLLSHHDVTTVAARLGYSTPAAFATTVTTTTGRPPSSYRPAR
ncbi:MAG TPA: helix-turn-helix transcriptional regulator [Propionibacteriaceae bacterium]|nr:helix-turn-helix transcriptional regulator [Propionibacteriaceae bacterium]